MPRWVKYTIALTVLASLVPLALIAKARFTVSGNPPLHLFFDMDQQKRFGAQDAAGELAGISPVFADGRVMRPPVAGTIRRESGGDSSHYRTGLVGGKPAATFPSAVRVEMALVERGRQRFNISCAPCHGEAGYGDGLVARRADRLQEGTWTPPSSLHTELVRSRPPGHLFGTITNGIRNMPAYGRQVPAADRWAIVAYIKALQRSQNASAADLPPAALRGSGG